MPACVWIYGEGIALGIAGTLTQKYVWNIERKKKKQEYNRVKVEEVRESERDSLFRSRDGKSRTR